jgi:hypothetical protein
MTFRYVLVAFVAANVCSGLSAAKAQVPDSDIWVSEVLVRGQTLDLGKPRNVTHRSGYDNQPCFLADSQNILFTAANAAGSTDIWRCDLGKKGLLTQVTNTPESEYSPAPFGTPATGFCTVRVEADSTQRMWRFDMDGKNPALVMTAVDSVGYFAWIDDTHLAAFILGNEKKKEPHTLRVIDVTTQAETIVARNIGRSIQRIPGTNDIVFTVQEGNEDRYRFFILKNGAHSGEPLIDAIGNGQDAAWMGNTMLHSSGTTIYAATPGGATPAWRPVRDFAAEGITGITRMAVAPDHSLIAFVAVSKPK